MNIRIQISANLLRNPYPHLPKLCSARTLPLEHAGDFQALSSLHVNSVPILLNYSEHYKFIVNLLKCINSCNPQFKTLLLRMQMPAGGRMPREFLHEQVLMLQDVSNEEAILTQEGKAYLVIEDTLIRHPLEAGQNTIRVRISSPDHCRDLVESICQRLHAHGFEGVETTFSHEAI
ncbi:hypothetical protein [uncultured Microbulbifer sp.]|uniref:hypothetical protein n=1 Tax=uncultured Microbulbifer sp. TaxID=348147 RepID=UPI00260E0423|nr:hypothetical protein [uncultured Microbulbifer sp.]